MKKSRSSLSRREFVRLGLYGLPAIYLAGCTTSVNVPPSVAPSASPAATVDIAALEAAAKKEGTVVWYAGTDPLQSDLMSKAFEGKYGIKVQVFRQSNEAIMQKLQAEFQANRLIADVLVLGDIGAARQLRDERRLTELQSPSAAALPAQFRSDPYYVVGNLLPTSIAWNTNLVPAEQAPQTYKDLLDPKWRGKIGMTTLDSLNTKLWYYATRKLYGSDYLRDLGAQKLRFTATNAELLQVMSVGEVFMASRLPYYVVLQAKVRKQPVTGRLVEPVIVDQSTVAVLSAAQHPNAGKLFAEFYLSLEGQALLAKEGQQFSPRTDVSPAGAPPLSSLKTYSLSLDEYADRAKRQAELDAEAKSFFGT